MINIAFLNVNNSLVPDQFHTPMLIFNDVIHQFWRNMANGPPVLLTTRCQT